MLVPRRILLEALLDEKTLTESDGGATSNSNHEDDGYDNHHHNYRPNKTHIETATPGRLHFTLYQPLPQRQTTDTAPLEDPGKP